METRGLLGADQFKLNNALSKAISNLAGLGQLGFNSGQISEGPHEIVVPPGASFMQVGWVFTDDYGREYVKLLKDANEEETRDVAIQLFYKVQAQQVKIADLEARLRRAENPALQLVG